MDIREKIEELGRTASALEPAAPLRSEWEKETLQYAHTFLESLRKTKAFHLNDDPATGLRQPDFGEEGKPVDQVLQLLYENLHNCGINPASGGHLGYIPGGGVYASALGDYLAAVTNQYAGIFFAGPGAVRMENQLLRWMCDLVGYPKTALGNLASGGSIANLIAFVTARDSKGTLAQIAMS